VRFGLTDQQRRVIEQLAAGDDVEQIAERLEVTAGRVHQVTAAAREAVATAAAIGLITVDHGQGAKLRRAREHLVAAARLMGDDS
jgi:DNA-binding FadR family transcriptional regulator